MSYGFGAESRFNLESVDKRLVRVLYHALSYGLADWSIIKGYRGKVEQDQAYLAGNSHAKWPDSKHNSNPSLAIDFIPFPFRGWDAKCDFVFVAAVILSAAKTLEVPCKWGGNWNKNNLIMEDKNWEIDLGHIELIEEINDGS